MNMVPGCLPGLRGESWATRPASGLVGWGDQVLLEFAVGVGVGGEGEVLAWVDDLEGVEGHAAAELFGNLVEG